MGDRIHDACIMKNRRERMKGIIFNLLEDFIVEKLGEEGYDKIIESCDLETREPFVGPGSYPDGDLFALAGKAAEAMGTPLPDALRAFGRFCIPELAKRFPAFFNPHDNPKGFLKSVESVIHTEVRKLYEDAEPPHFEYEDPAPDRLVMRYRSRRRLCRLMEGLLEGVGDYYKTPISQRQRGCMLDGADECVFELEFQRL